MQGTCAEGRNSLDVRAGFKEHSGYSLRSERNGCDQWRLSAWRSIDVGAMGQQQRGDLALSIGASLADAVRHNREMDPIR